MNPLYQMMMNKMPQGNNDLVTRFQQFRNSFSGDPRQQVEQLLKSGRVSQQQYDAAVRMANQFKNMM